MGVVRRSPVRAIAARLRARQVVAPAKPPVHHYGPHSPIYDTTAAYEAAHKPRAGWGN